MASDTRQRILDAALACFLEDGYEQATIARIRERSGVSNGALFHHFPSKEAVAEALYVQAIESFQSGLWEMLRRRPRSLHVAVRGTIAHQLSWVELNRDLARFVYARGHLDWESEGAAAVSALNAELSAAFRAWMTPLIDRGELRVSSMLLISAIVNGPAHAIARRWLAGQLESRPSTYVEALADAAQAALQGRGADTASSPAAPTYSRVTVEMLDEDGTVTARAQHRLALNSQPAAATPPRRTRKDPA
jgi:AcrR family transcriptional regulator